MIHGLGDLGATQAHQISSSLRRSDPELFSKFNFIIPHAGLIRISVFEKDIRPGWFDIRSWDNINEDEDLDGFYSSVRSLQLMMTELGLDLNRTIVAGFSQGAVMSLLLTLTLKRPPLLTIMMSGYFPIQETIKELILQGKRNSIYRSEEFVRLYWLHGRLDPYFKIKTIRENFKRLKNYLKLRFLIDNQSSIRDVTNRTDSLDVRLLAENQSSSRPQKNLNDWNISRVSIVEFKEFEGLDHNWNDQEIQFILQTFKKLPIY
ncbi:Alpha/Beta hydrolase protein [Phakopsora pachyrhizi]|nr:Alpha/Beta hydrolase protein [Phakopsora pachyrhizi]